jgi:hypothetical protein
MFGHRHYVPILRWKEAERLALRELDNDIRDRITRVVRTSPFISVPQSSPHCPARLVFTKTESRGCLVPWVRTVQRCSGVADIEGNVCRCPSIQRGAYITTRYVVTYAPPARIYLSYVRP